MDINVGDTVILKGLSHQRKFIKGEKYSVDRVLSGGWISINNCVTKEKFWKKVCEKTANGTIKIINEQGIQVDCKDVYITYTSEVEKVEILS